MRPSTAHRRWQLATRWRISPIWIASRGRIVGAIWAAERWGRSVGIIRRSIKWWRGVRPHWWICEGRCTMWTMCWVAISVCIAVKIPIVASPLSGSTPAIAAPSSVPTSIVIFSCRLVGPGLLEKVASRPQLRLFVRKLAASIIAASTANELTAHTCTCQVWLAADLTRIVCEWALHTFCACASLMELAHLRLHKLFHDLGLHAITHHDRRNLVLSSQPLLTVTENLQKPFSQRQRRACTPAGP